MSIADNLNRIKTAKEAIKTAINNKGGGLTNEKIEAYATAIDNLKLNDDTDYTGVNVTVNNMLEGITAIDATGNKITGNIKNWQSNPQKGYTISDNKISLAGGCYPENLTIEVPTTDLSFVTATANDIISGKTGIDINGNPVYGNIQDVTDQVQISGNVITIPTGFFSDNKTYRIGNSPITYAIIPGIDDQYIDPGIYVDAPIRIQGSVWLSPEYIKKDITMFGVTGSYSGEPVNLSFVTATSNDILSGKTGSDSNGNPVYGMMLNQTGTQMINYNEVELNKGFYENTTFTVGNAIEGRTITPGIEDNIINANSYLKDNIIIKGDANLLAENIKKGKSIFGVNGSFEQTASTGTMEFYKCNAVYGPREVACFIFSGCPDSAVNGAYLPTEFTIEDWQGNKNIVYSNGNGWYYCYTEWNMAWGLTMDYTNGGLRYSGSLGSSWWDNNTWEEVSGMTGVESTTIVDANVPKTWDGYKAVQSSGVYTFESEVTTGLTYTNLKPEKYQIYSADAAIKIDWLPENFPTENLILFAPLTNDLDNAEVGGAIKHSKTSELGTLNDTNCTVFTNSNDGIFIDCDGGIIGTGELTVFFQFSVSTFNQGIIFDVGGKFGLYPVDNNNHNLRFNRDAAYTQTIEQNQWYTVLLVRRKKEELSLFFDGQFKHQYTFNGNILQTLQLGHNWFFGGIRNVLIYNRALSEAEIGQLVDKFGYIYPPTILAKTSVTLIAYLENEISKQLSATVKYNSGETPTFSSSNMPAGLSISSDGRITGTPTALGTGSSTVIVSSPGADSVQITVNWEVKDASEKPIVSEDLIFYAPLTTLSSVAETGQELAYTDTPQVTKLNGRSCMLFSNGQGIETIENIGISGNFPRTISFWALPSENVPDYPSAVFWGSDNGEYSKRVLFGPKRNGDNIRLMFGGWSNDTEFSTDIKLDNKLHHCAMVYTGSELRLFVDGVHGGGSVSGLNTTDSKLRIAYANVASGYAYSGYLSEVRVYNRALSDAEITELANEFNNDEPDVPDTPDTPTDKAYAYTITDAGNADANGNYWDSGKIKEFFEGNSSKVYINDKGWELYYDYDMLFWALTSEEHTLNYGIAYSGPGDPNASPVGTYSDFNAGDGSSPIVSEYSGGSSTPEAGDKTYVYTVSGFDDDRVNGDYWDTGLVENGSSVYTNGTINLVKSSVIIPGYIYWSLSDGDTPLYCTADTEPDYTGGYGWFLAEGDHTGDTPAAGTVTAYVGDSNDDSVSATYVYTASNAGSINANGNYRLVTADERANKTIGNYTNISAFASDNSDCKYTYWTNDECLLCLGEAISDLMDGNYWCITDLSNGKLYYEHMGDGTRSTTPIDVSWSVYEGKSPVPTFTEYIADSDESGDEDDSSGNTGDNGNGDGQTYVYTVSGFPERVQRQDDMTYIENVDDNNGDYYDTGETLNGQPIYYNDKKYLLSGDLLGMGENGWFFSYEKDITQADFGCYVSNIKDMNQCFTFTNAPVDPINGIIVTDYVGGNGGGTEPAHDYIVTVLGIDDDVAGNYYDSGLTSDSLPIYVHENDKYYILHVGDYWRLMSVESYNDDFVWFDLVYNYDNLFGQTQGGRIVAPYGFELQYKYQVTGHGDCEGRYYQHFEEQNGKPVYIQQHRFGTNSSYKTIKWSGDYWVITTMGGDVMGHSTGADITGDWVDEFGDTLLTIVEI